MTKRTLFVPLAIVATLLVVLFGTVGAMSQSPGLAGQIDGATPRLYEAASPSAGVGFVLTKTVGTDPNACATSNMLALPAGGGTAVYCYTVANGTPFTYTSHDLVDSELGTILANFPFTLTPGLAVFLTQSATITVDTTNVATWTARANNTDPASAVATATVTILPPVPDIVLTKTVGTDPNVCATTDTQALGPGGGMVTYCYTVTNTGGVTLTRHDLDDDQLGTILSDFAFALAPGATVFLTQSTMITQTTLNSAIWTGYNPGPTDVVTSTDNATVTVTPPTAISLSSLEAGSAADTLPYVGLVALAALLAAIGLRRRLTV